MQVQKGSTRWRWVLNNGKVKVKCTLVRALRFCTGRAAHRGSRDIALLFLDHGTRRGEGSASRPGRSLPPGKSRYPLYRRLHGPQGRSGQVRKISPPTGIRSPDRPARSQSLYRLRYPAQSWTSRQQSYRQGHGTANCKICNQSFILHELLCQRSLWGGGRQWTTAPLVETAAKIRSWEDPLSLEIIQEYWYRHSCMGRSKWSYAISSGRLQLWRDDLRYKTFKFSRSAKRLSSNGAGDQLHFSKAETNQRPPAK